MMDAQQGMDVQNQREKYAEETKDMSRSELNKYNQQVLKEARKRLAEKYGDTYDEKRERQGLKGCCDDAGESAVRPKKPFHRETPCDIP